MHITFLGAAREVTGSSYLVESVGARFLVDCGLFQGGLDADQKNRATLPIDASAIDFVLLTHAHIDHSGLLPLLVSRGFKGPIYATPATVDLLEPMLADSAALQEKARERGEALYRSTDALATVRQAHGVGYEQPFAPAPGIACRFRDAGHILGSASIEVRLQENPRERVVVFSGDIGPFGRPLVRDAALVERGDIVLIESTYGDRAHKPLDATLDELARAISETLQDGRGNVVVPAFAVGRTQELIYLLIRLVREGRLPEFDVIVDSPLATKATAVTLKHWKLLDPDVGPLFEAAMRPGARPRIRFTESVEESAAISRRKDGALVVAGSGMCDGGRIQYHLRDNLPRPDAAIVFIGYQAAGTIGRRIVDGAKRIRLFGEEVQVQARIYTIGGLSAHADQADLLRWAAGFKTPPKRAFVVHGEAPIAQTFVEALRGHLAWPAEAPSRGTRVAL
jgi:metallo-beta-lactamase family protein